MNGSETDLLDAPAYDAVVQDYLDFMLRAVTDPLISFPETAEPDPSPPARIVSPPVDNTPAPTVKAVDFSMPVAAQVMPAAEPKIDGKPQWVEEEFSCLLFHVNGLKLVAPLTELGGIAELGELTPIFAQPAWFMGLSRWNGRNIRVIDTARLIMPERIAEGDAHRNGYQCVLMLDDSEWGLAIDGKAESIRLHSNDVRWRHHAKSRPWLAGTVADRLCALLDVRALTVHLSAPEGCSST